MKKLNTIIALGVTLATAGTLLANEKECVNVSGKVVEVTVPAENEPIGRVAGQVVGVLNGAITAYIKTFIPNQTFTVIDLTTEETFVTGAGDTLVTSGAAHLTQSANQPPGNFDDTLTLTVKSGTGKWAGASSGTIVLTGKGYNFFSAPGNAYFELSYKGTVCRD
jgi:hypothetical protein